jgi:hypothetical protein
MIRAQVAKVKLKIKSVHKSAEIVYKVLKVWFRNILADSALEVTSGSHSR